MKRSLLVAADFVRTGGMDMANYALARYLANQGLEVHLVTHRAAEELAIHPNIIVHPVVKPGNSYFLGAPLLGRIGRRWASKITACGGRVLVNGGNCCWGDLNWVHYVHAAYTPRRRRIRHRIFLAQERSALRRARIVIANSNRSKQDIVERLGVPAARVHTVYYGVDAELFHPSTPIERRRAKAALGWVPHRPVVAFVGALGNERKGFDTLFAAWKALCSDSLWDADLAVAGAGRELASWRKRAAEAGIAERIHFLGFRKDVGAVLAACDALVSPTRYEAYGLNVQEALCCEIPAFVTRTAGVAERYPAELRHLLIEDPEDVTGLIDRLRDWGKRPEQYRLAVGGLSQDLRSKTWDDMAARIIRLAEL